MLRKVLIAKSNNVFQKGRPGWPCIILIQGAPSFCEMFVALPPSLGHVHELEGLIVAQAIPSMAILFFARSFIPFL